MKDTRPSEAAYPYRIYTTGGAGVFRVLCFQKDIDKLWDSILKGKPPEFFYPDTSNSKFINMKIRPESIIAVDNAYGSDPINLNTVMNAGKESASRSAKPRMTSSRIQIGKNARR